MSNLAWGASLLACFVSLPGAGAFAPLGLRAPDERTYENARFGFKLKAPKDWERIPLPPEEDWLVAKYVSKRLDHYTHPDLKYTFEHRPELLVIVFIHPTAEEEEEDEPEEVDEADVKEAEERGLTVRRVETGRYRNYEDYLDRTYFGGGFHVSEREEKRVDGVDVTRVEVKVEKLSFQGPKRIETWVYHLSGVDVAVQVEVLEDEWRKKRNTVKRVHNSFREIPRSGEALGEQSIQIGWITIQMMETGSAGEREQTRKEAEQEKRRKIEERLTEGWTAEEMGRCYVVTHVDEKYSEEVAEQATAVLDWLDENLGFIGPDQYVREPVIRICADREEESAFRGRVWWSIGTEIVTHKSPGNFDNFEWEWMNRKVCELWLRERDRKLFWALPTWLSYGILDYLENSYLKGKKLEFRADSWDRDELRNHIREGKATTPADLMRLSARDYWSSGTWNRQREAAALVRFFLSKESSRNARTKGVLQDYIRHLIAVIDEIEAEEEAKKEEKERKPKTEAEEDAMYKARANAWKDREKRVLDTTWERTFGAWSERDWRTFDKAYFKAVG